MTNGVTRTTISRYRSFREYTQVNANDEETGRGHDLTFLEAGDVLVVQEDGKSRQVIVYFPHMDNGIFQALLNDGTQISGANGDVNKISFTGYHIKFGEFKISQPARDALRQLLPAGI